MRLNDLPPTVPAQALLKDALARRPAGVAVITVQDGSGVRATTVGSFIGLSIAPPLVAFTCALRSRTLALLPREAHAGLALLGEHQEAIARACADPARRAFDAAALERDAWGAPVIGGAAARFSLRVAGHHTVGDHVLVVASVLAAQAGTAPPLLYQDRRYRRLSASGKESA